MSDFEILPEALYQKDLRIVKGLVLRYIQMGLSFIDYLVRRMEVEGISLDYSYNIMNSPRGFVVTITFTIRDIDPRELHKIAKRVYRVAKGVMFSKRELKRIYDLIEQQLALISQKTESQTENEKQLDVGELNE